MNEQVIEASRQECISLLGCQLIIRGQVFYLRMLELYLGAEGDPFHDWTRGQHYPQRRIFQRTQVQIEQGLKFYLRNDINPRNRRNRVDIVSREPIACSFLIRSVWNSNWEVIGDNRKGSPNLVLRAFNLNSNDHGAIIHETCHPIQEINLCNTHEEIFLHRNLQVLERPRIGLNAHVRNPYMNFSWNFTAVERN